MALFVGVSAGLALGAALGAALGWALGRQGTAPAAELAQTQGDLAAAREEKAALAAQLEAERKAWEAQRQEDKEARKAEFENLANRIFEDKQAKARQGIEALIAPVQERIREDIKLFREKVDHAFGQEARDKASLKAQIEHIAQASAALRTQADDLTRALQTDPKVRGNWGEVQLHKILEESGLRPGRDYTLQASVTGADGGRYRPDAVVNLPEGRHIVVDAKTPLVHFAAYRAAEDDAARALALRAFLAGLRERVRGLGDKAYQASPDLASPDFVLMFVPIEGAYALAVQEDPGLFPFAWERKVTLVCPATLFAVLKTVESVWRLERQNRNTAEIARLGGALHDKLSGFMDSMGGVDKAITAAGKAYGEALVRLQGRGGALSLADRMRALGLKTKGGPLLPSQEGPDGGGEGSSPGGEDGPEAHGQEGQGDEDLRR
jgi:DNA recombination protein RmuC